MGVEAQADLVEDSIECNWEKLMQFDPASSARVKVKG